MHYVHGLSWISSYLMKVVNIRTNILRINWPLIQKGAQIHMKLSIYWRKFRIGIIIFFVCKSFTYTVIQILKEFGKKRNTFNVFLSQFFLTKNLRKRWMALPNLDCYLNPRRLAHGRVKSICARVFFNHIILL